MISVGGRFLPFPIRPSGPDLVPDSQTPRRITIMASHAQFTANRNNAQQSTGPRTPEGKLAAAQNARRHGLSGAHVILPGESEAAYDGLLDGLRAEHNASGITENFLIEQMAQAQWKLLRIARMEQQLLQPNKPLLEQCPPGSHPDMILAAQFNIKCTFADATMRHLLRYEAAARRAYMQSLRQLLTLQKQRALEAKALSAQPVTKNYKTKPIPSPAPEPVRSSAPIQDPFVRATPVLQTSFLTDGMQPTDNPAPPLAVYDMMMGTNPSGL
jgi:hypothetical protein